LQCSYVNRAGVGDFLGEALSLSSLTRLSLFDSIPLFNTGVVTALRAAFSVFQLPEDFQKINRLLSALAHVWWRRHKEPKHGASADDNGYLLPDSSLETETSGSELRVCLTSLDSLAQLMFSTIMLHWFMHGDGSSDKREMSCTQWMTLNCGLGDRGGDIPLRIQESIYNVINEGFLQELALTSAKDKAWHLDEDEVHWERFAGATTKNHGSNAGHSYAVDGGTASPQSTSWQSALASCATLEGWAQHNPIGAQIMNNNLPSSMSEVPFSLSAPMPGVQFSSGENQVDSVMNEVIRSEFLFLKPRQGAKIWLSLCGSLLFFWGGISSSGSSSAMPHMFLDLMNTQVRSRALPKPEASDMHATLIPSTTDNGNATVVTLVSAPRLPPSRPSPGKSGSGARSPRAATCDLDREGKPCITVVHLLPDGRWQELHLTRLELRFPNAAEAEAWAGHLSMPAPKPTVDPIEAAYTNAAEDLQSWQARISDECIEIDVDDIKDSLLLPADDL